MLNKCSLFEEYFSYDTKVKLLKLMKTVVISPESVITSQLP